MDMPDHEALVQQFIELTSVAPEEATQYLTANQWDLSSALTEYFTSQEEIETGNNNQENHNAQESKSFTGPRTLDGRPAPESHSAFSSSSRNISAPKKKSGIATLDSLSQEQSSRDNFDDADNENQRHGLEPRNLFAGGEKSGLAVQDPNENQNHPKNVARDILKMAKANAARLGGEKEGETSANQASKFLGNGQTLGGDDTPSQVIPNPYQASSELAPAQTRTLHLWADGFSIEDGQLHRFDDPQNTADLQMIRQGRAPVHLMGVRDNQLVDVQLINHNENYKAPPKVYKPFSGTANRLGSPVPSSMIKSQSSPSATMETPVPDLDQSQPIIRLRIQLVDGTRLPAQFNASHTIGHVHEFIERAAPTNNSRSWILATTFPTKNHTEKTLRLGDIPEIKKGGTIIQKML